MEGPITDWLVRAGMFSLMFGMGLTLTVADFRRVAVVPRAAVVGTLLQLLAMPLAGLALAHAFGMEPLLAAGLVIVAACPGGVMSNLLVHLGRADTALSITLTATATAAALFTIPLWVRGVLASLGEVGASVEMPFLETARRLGGFTILPVVIGMALRAPWPALATRERWITRAGALVIVGALTAEALGSADPPVAQLEASWLPALLLLGGALALGLGAPRLVGLGWRESATIAVEVCIKNTVLGLFVATQSLGSLEAGVPIAAFMAFQAPVGIGVLVFYNLWRRREERGELAG